MHWSNSLLPLTYNPVWISIFKHNQWIGIKLVIGCSRMLYLHECKVTTTANICFYFAFGVYKCKICKEGYGNALVQLFGTAYRSSKIRNNHLWIYHLVFYIETITVSYVNHHLMANIWEKVISILAGNLNLGRSYLITTVTGMWTCLLLLGITV